MKVGDRVICTDRDCRVLIPGNEYRVFEVDSNFPKPRCKVLGEFQCEIAATLAWFEQRYFEIDTEWVSKSIDETLSGITDLFTDVFETADTTDVEGRTGQPCVNITITEEEVAMKKDSSADKVLQVNGIKLIGWPQGEDAAANDSQSYDEDDSPGQKQFDDKRKKRDLDCIDAGIEKEEEKDRKAETVSNAIDKTLNRSFLGWIDYLG